MSCLGYRVARLYMSEQPPKIGIVAHLQRADQYAPAAAQTY